jgi:hypothetical protein
VLALHADLRTGRLRTSIEIPAPEQGQQLKTMGSTRGSAETGFIRSVDEAVDRFHATVVTALNRGAR